MAVVLVLLVLLAGLAAAAVAIGIRTARWRPPLGRRIVLSTALLFSGCTVYACGDLAGTWFYVSPREAEAEFEAVLGFDVPNVDRVLDARDLGWAPTDGPYYGYTAEFDSTGFSAFMERWSARHDSLSWVRLDTADYLEHRFEVVPESRRVKYFHAAE